MNKEDIKELLDRYSKGLCSQEECRRIERYILKNPIVSDWQWEDEQHKNRTAKVIKAGLPMLQGHRSARVRWIRWGASAAVAMLLVVGIWFFNTEKSTPEDPSYVIAEAKDYSSDKVTITLPNGEIQTLEGTLSAADLKALIQQGEGDRATEVWLTIQVPSRQHQEVILADGSSIWLNAGSVLRFPQTFTGKHRHVYLEGEGYFDIVHNTAKPFRVFAGKGEIEVTGTKFNVQAYSEQKLIRTSLVQGGVNFYMDEKAHKLTPGIELIADTEKDEIKRQKFDINQLTSWKDGYFTFDNLELLDVMKMVSRWYNITVTSDVNFGSKRIGGTFPTGLPLDELLEDLSILSGVKFEIQGKEVRIVR
ncbi:FecR family protein [Sphingobacterium tabacisoli]|uniref:FecR family protein n=1 Tax=Sphingobacterium tabacisoli TaxID=2044855 RepID=A0ABW5L0X2_9SPHI|nr:FecR domain-containing protein [Sphingobacterium tabacisoli]